MFIIFGGLPGVGKTTIAKALAKQLKAVYLRIDTVEQVLKRETQLDGPEGYMVCYALALENLKLGMTVVADSVNAIQVTRDAWQNVAKDASVTFFEIELVCSDSREHQQRIETRSADIVGHQLPKWQDVKEREYEQWSPHLVFDTAKKTSDEIVEKILEHIIAQEKPSLRHVALAVHKLDECEKFYNMLSMKTELKTEDYVYLSGHDDNISLHRIEDPFSSTQIGIKLLQHGIKIEHLRWKLYQVNPIGPRKKDIVKGEWLISLKEFDQAVHQAKMLNPKINICAQSIDKHAGRYFMIFPDGMSHIVEQGDNGFPQEKYLGNVFENFDEVLKQLMAEEQWLENNDIHGAAQKF